MTDTPATPASAPPSPSKKASAARKIPRKVAEQTKSSHPPTSEMVNKAIQDLKERGGSSLQAIKKYIAVNYQVDVEKTATFIKKYLKSAVSSGTLVQTKGKGASGSFKLAAATKSTGAASVGKTSKGTKRAPKEKKVPTASKVVSKKKSPTKKAAVSSSAATSKTKKTTTAASKKTVAAKTKTPTKAKKVAKSPTKKPKAPKPKKAVSPKAVKATKKVAQKKN